jgi:hypothetical protein
MVDDISQNDPYLNLETLEKIYKINERVLHNRAKYNIGESKLFTIISGTEY